MFKNYEPGEPTCRLYVKNIAKQVEEKVGPILALDTLLYGGFWFTGVLKTLTLLYIGLAQCQLSSEISHKHHNNCSIVDLKPFTDWCVCSDAVTHLF